MKNALSIRQANPEDKTVLADIIRRAYRTVADDFNLTTDNCPKHPSNCTADWIIRGLDRGVVYFLLMQDQTPVGCAALEKADTDTCYLERLAVLPHARHKGFGKKLVNHIIGRAKIYKAKTVGIGIIEEQTVLKQWYKDLGFKAVGTKKFDHLPFTVGFMQIDPS